MVCFNILIPSPSNRPAACANAANNARDVSAAEPIANPLPVAAVVFPSASNASVRCRTSGAN